MALSAIAYFIMQSIDIIILSIYEGFDQIAYYSVSVKLAMLTTLALMSVNIVIAPKRIMLKKTIRLFITQPSIY